MIENSINKNVSILKSIDFYDEKNVSKEQWDKFRSIISGWADHIPHHNIVDFGNAIEITSIIEYPSYTLNLITSYENRVLKEKNIPYTGWKIPEKVIDRNNVDIWRAPRNDVSPFNEYQVQYEFKKSQSVYKCKKCNGSGNVTCYTCNGRKELKCDYCNGYGKLICGKCDGHGTVRCPRYCRNGKVKIEYKDREYLADCDYCGGRSVVPCDVCIDGKVICSKCDGYGTLRCVTCNETGLLKCSVCNGNGKLVNLLFVDIKIYNLQNESKVFNENIPIALVDKISHLTGENLVQIIEPLFEREVSKYINNWKLRINLEKLFIKHNNQVNDNTKILHQKLSIYKLNTYLINYSFKGNNYSIYISNDYNNKFKIYPIPSPFSDLTYQLCESSINNFINKNYTEAINLSKKVLDIDQDNNLIKTLISKSEKEIEVERLKNYYISKKYEDVDLLVTELLKIFPQRNLLIYINNKNKKGLFVNIHIPLFISGIIGAIIANKIISIFNKTPNISPYLSLGISVLLSGLVTIFLIGSYFSPKHSIIYKIFVSFLSSFIIICIATSIIILSSQQ